MHHHHLAIFTLVLAASAASGQDFNWQNLEGKWAESTKHQFGCRPDNLHQRLEISPDRKTLKFKNDRRWKIGTGQEVTEYTAAIVRAQENSLFIKYGPELEGIPPEYREWEMRFIGPGTYRWRAASWGRDDYNDVIGVKCDQ